MTTAVNITKLPLSGGSGNGRGIKVVATADAGTTVHTCSSTTTDIDELWLYCYNSSASAVVLTVELGGNTSPDDLVQYSGPPQNGYYTIIPGFPLVGAGTPLVVKCYGSSANVLVVNGFINRISQI
jgi:hypothetical protein